MTGRIAIALLALAARIASAEPVCGSNTPLTLIEALRPDMLVKGADYTIDQVVGADVVQGYGGRVVLVPIMPGRSTSGTIVRLRTVAGGES